MVNISQAGAIITNRFILIIATIIVKDQGYYAIWPCAKIEATISNASDLLFSYPTCAAYANGTNPTQVAIVAATFDQGDAANTGAALNVNFGMALWLAFVIHALGVEIYLHLTPKEAQRLRQVSYQRQLEAGMKNPGSAGLTADRLGDAEEFIPDCRKDSVGTLRNSPPGRPRREQAN